MVMMMDPVAEIVRQGAIAVTSCEEESSSEDDEDKEEDLHEDDERYQLLDDLADEEDEAYVYKHLRSGVAEVVQLDHSGDDADPAVPFLQQQQQHRRLKVLKPRNSDAVLSCPCCFTIVCMDCQQHERYDNLYRAMFVQSIAVRWDWRLRYDESKKLLVPMDGDADGSLSLSVPPIVVDELKALPRDNEAHKETKIYYTVCCANCHTVVASLDMNDEVYYFANCLTSS